MEECFLHSYDSKSASYCESSSFAFPCLVSFDVFVKVTKDVFCLVLRFPYVFRATFNSNFFILIGLRSLSEQDASYSILSLISKFSLIFKFSLMFSVIFSHQH